MSNIIITLLMIIIFVENIILLTINFFIIDYENKKKIQGYIEKENVKNRKLERLH